MPFPAKLSAEQILNAATQILEYDGSEALTMRSLAERLSVRPSSLYRHFENRETLLRAIGDMGALQLRDTLQGAATGQPARQALITAADAYLNYARQHPHIYALLLTKGPPLTPEQLRASAGKQLWDTLLALVGRLSGNPDDTDHAVAFWTFLHGFASLTATGTYGASGPQGGLQVGLDALLDHMESARA